MRKTKKFIIIIGLPGSGKTTLANQLAKKNKSALVLDDLSLNFMEGVRRFKEADPYITIITDPKLCGVDEERIKEIIHLHFYDNEGEAKTFKFKFVYFANEPESCIINASRDPKPGGTENFIRTYTKRYKIPEKALVLPVYKVLDNQ